VTTKPWSTNSSRGRSIARGAVERFLGLVVMLLVAVPCNTAVAGVAVEVGQTLPPISITQGGQVIIEGTGYSVAPWSGPGNVGLVQVIQYVPGTRRGGDLYDPLTERMRRELEVARYRITAIVNIEVASRFAKPFVRAAVVDKQRAYSLATLVLDEGGTGQIEWDLSQQSAFIVTDTSGKVVDAIFGEPSEIDSARIFQTLKDLLQSKTP